MLASSIGAPARAAQDATARAVKGSGDYVAHHSNNFSEGVSALIDAHYSAARSIALVKATAGELLHQDHGSKLEQIQLLKDYCNRLLKALPHPTQVTPEELTDLIEQGLHDFRTACHALAGPHVTLIAAFKFSANVLVQTKRLTTSETNAILSRALHAVNAINHAWRFVQSYALLIQGCLQHLPATSACRARLIAAHDNTVTVIQQAQSFSEGARMQVAEESFRNKLRIPKGKAYRLVTAEGLLQAGPCIRSEVCFRHKGKPINKVPKAQPMRLSIFGHVVILTASTLEAEKLLLPPVDLSCVSASAVRDGDGCVFALALAGKYDIELRCKTALLCDQWLSFFRDPAAHVAELQHMHKTFRTNLELAERTRASTPVNTPYQESANLSLLTHRQFHPATRKPNQAWGGCGGDEGDTVDDTARNKVSKPAAEALDDGYMPVGEALGDGSDRGSDRDSVSDVTEALDSMVNPVAGAPNLDGSGCIDVHGAETASPSFEAQAQQVAGTATGSLSDLADDPFKPRELASDTTGAPRTSHPLGLTPPPVNTRPRMNAPIEFKADFESADAQKALGGRVVRRIPVKPLKRGSSTDILGVATA
ncbi:uncharacterized protein MONBRDRAFT_5836 [Monosiga brevicollis MX1]|uniref:Uncharacterized protein n=1 Tax=Monosiga brevicollis TaxID=81824 RepID=A9USL8_MONBE|nr:uncharacterized protein MONBRDRAFT_5836 [Monosiga brevicollis MX1]EDQ91803.1 predicted protein [Monosiga brevicollis MX1]|eukprot:XP_001743089.1 hypothetical protein [Monosiga brevicollis MX1]